MVKRKRVGILIAVLLLTIVGSNLMSTKENLISSRDPNDPFIEWHSVPIFPEDPEKLEDPEEPTDPEEPETPAENV